MTEVAPAPLVSDKTPVTPIVEISLGAPKKVTDDLRKWTDSTAWWVVKGTTGSGKTYFVEQVKDRLIANRSPVIYVPQYPMFKPQLGVKKYISLLPLSDSVRQELYQHLEKLEVPTDKAIGGKLMGMLEIPGLSGGQRKKLLIAVCVALAIELQCPFVVLDEPFAGVDATAMRAVLNVMSKATIGVKNLKYIIVTHDHFDLLPKSATLLEVNSRQITSPNTDYSNDNVSAAVDFTIALNHGQMAVPAQRPIFDLYVVKRHFIEQEFVMPLLAYIIFGLIMGGAMVKYEGGLPGYGRDAIYCFMKGFFFEYPHFGNIINYCYKRGQHYEDLYLNITSKEYAVFETLVIILIQMTLLWVIAEAILCGICDFWWINAEVALIDLTFVLQDSCYFMLLPLVAPNPIVAILSALPYVCSVVFINGVLLPQEFLWSPLRWLAIFSPVYHTSCAYKQVTDKIRLEKTDCADSLVVHLLFCNPAFAIIIVAVVVKMLLDMRKRDHLVIPGLAPQNSASQDDTDKASDFDALDKTEDITNTRMSLKEALRAPLNDAMKAAFENNDWWVVKGATGSGKSFFLESMKHQLKSVGGDVVFVPQYPMFKPQVLVMRFVKLLPLSSQIQSDMLQNMADMEVPMKGPIGGKMMGMLDLKGLSGGQRKKLLIAEAVAIASQFQSKFLVMDEPFAGIDLKSMIAVTNVLKKAIVASPGLKIIVSTHDHFETFKEFATVVNVEDRVVSVNKGYARDNQIAATEFTNGMTAKQAGTQRKPFIDLFVIKRHFIEQEPVLPIVQSALFAILLGLTVIDYDGGHPSRTWGGAEVVYIFMKAFVLEYPLFGGIINFCYKREQHMEDYFMNASSSKFCVFETIVIAIVQQCLMVGIATGLLCALKSDFWWLNGWIVLIDMWYATFAAIGYFLLPIVIPNPILAMASIFPYVCTWGFANGILLPKNEMWDGMQWMTTFSPLYNLGCAYAHATDKKEISIRSTDCYDSIVPHILFITPLPWLIGLGVLYQMFKPMRAKPVQKVMDLDDAAESRKMIDP